MTTKRCQHPDGCDRPYHAKGWCRLHYRRLLRQKPLGPKGLIRLCAIPGCHRPAADDDMCARHAAIEREKRERAERREATRRAAWTEHHQTWTPECGVEDCQALVWSDGLCRGHHLEGHTPTDAAPHPVAVRARRHTGETKGVRAA